MKYGRILTLSLGLAAVFAACVSLSKSSTGFDEQLAAKSAQLDSLFVEDVLVQLGASPADHYQTSPQLTDVRRGYEIVHLGRTTAPNGTRSKFVSKYYQCTSCHNTVPEASDLTSEDPEARLDYAIANEIPFLQGSTLYGIVNRRSWYNGDYERKYGQLVEPARHSLEGSVQLCAKVCAAGRTLEPWEMNAVISYLNTLGLRVNDLTLDDGQLQNLQQALASGDTAQHAQAIAHLQARYRTDSPATFGKLPASKRDGYPIADPDPKRGAAIYRLGCQHCHREYGESDLVLDESQATKNWMLRHLPDNGPLSLYEIVRKGTYSASGHQEYMPQYPLEKMSDRQVEDLRAWLEE